jgi:hypothetical protein
MNSFKLGDVVMVVGKIDTRVRDKNLNEVIAGTIEQFLSENQVSVFLATGDIWVGHIRDIVLLEDQS